MTAPPQLALVVPVPPDAVPGDPPTGTASEDARTLAASIREPDRFTLIFDRHFHQIHAYVARRLGTDVADDVTSETFLVAFRQRATFDSRHGIVRGWLYGIATNLIRRHRRDEIRAWRAAGKLQPAVAAPAPDDQVAARVTAQGASAQLSAALAELSPADREVLMLVALAELSYEEVAAALGIPYGTVCSRLSRARRTLRQTLGSTDPTTDLTADAVRTSKDQHHG